MWLLFKVTLTLEAVSACSLYLSLIIKTYCLPLCPLPAFNILCCDPSAMVRVRLSGR